MDISLKSIADEITLELTKFQPTDEGRVPDEFLYAKIHQARAEAIITTYKKTHVLDPSWFQDLGMVNFHRVNFADDINITSCKCDISKATIPAFISLEAGNGNQDLGLNVISACGKTKYYPYKITFWKDIPSDHERSMFRYFDRFNTTIYVNHLTNQLRLYGILQNPADGIFVNSAPIASGSIANGVEYTVKYGQIVYDGAVVLKDGSFTGTTGVTTFSGTGTVYLANQVEEYNVTDPYPVGADMARQIVLDILVKEFGIERQMIPDTQNDSRDDATKVKI